MCLSLIFMKWIFFLHCVFISLINSLDFSIAEQCHNKEDIFTVWYGDLTIPYIVTSIDLYDTDLNYVFFYPFKNPVLNAGVHWQSFLIPLLHQTLFLYYYTKIKAREALATLEKAIPNLQTLGVVGDEHGVSTR